MDYYGYQMQNVDDVSKEIDVVLRDYIKKHGLPEQILLEVSDQLESVELPDNLNIVKKAVRVPKNILLIGRLE